ncbi:hypothetical protein SEA_CHOCOLAT_102 [Arthrobacter phage Chocolat]|nr:hypothetical protein SEA_CHOCOLAT_102 [Arthrobacter phage Chocolat]QBP30474.1 hypothetical protein SEA_CHIPPER1996_103 [Arthrobacter phage Chipper1996]
MTATAAERYETLKAEVQDLPLTDPRHIAYLNAFDNVVDTEREEGRKLEREEWASLYMSSYACSLEVAQENL